MFQITLSLTSFGSSFVITINIAIVASNHLTSFVLCRCNIVKARQPCNDCRDVYSTYLNDVCRRNGARQLDAWVVK